MTETLRSCIISEPNYTFLSLDASQIELRVLAILSQDPQMLADLETGDLHAATAIRMYGHTDDVELMAKWRYASKQGNFATIYEAGEETLAILLDCTVEEAREFMEEHQAAYPRMYEWKEERKAQAKEDGYVINQFGRIRPLPELYADNWKIRQKAEREVVNTLVQGQAVDTVKLAMLYLRRILDPAVRLVLQVHDEILWEVPDRLLAQSLELCKELAGAFPLYPFSTKTGKIYGEMEGQDEK